MTIDKTRIVDDIYDTLKIKPGWTGLVENGDQFKEFITTVVDAIIKELKEHAVVNATVNVTTACPAGAGTGTGSGTGDPESLIVPGGIT